jgi:hypothetical protein
VILNKPLCEINRVIIVPANEIFELGTVAVLRDLAQAVLLHARNLREFSSTRNLVFRPWQKQKAAVLRLRSARRLWRKAGVIRYPSERVTLLREIAQMPSNA